MSLSKAEETSGRWYTFLTRPLFVYFHPFQMKNKAQI